MEFQFRKIFFFIIVVILIGNIRPTGAQEPLKLVNDPWPPFTGETLPGKGLATEIVVTALHRSGYQTQVDFLPWKRALRGTFSGKYDILLTTSYSEERAKQVVYSAPYLANTVKFIKRNNTPYTYEEFSDLDGVDIAIIGGYIYEPTFDKATNFTKIEGVDTFSNIKMLLAKRVDMIVEDEWVARYLLKNKFPVKNKKVEFLPKPLNVKNLHIIIRKTMMGHEKIISDFNDAIANMRKDGSYEKILKRHLQSLE